MFTLKTFKNVLRFQSEHYIPRFSSVSLPYIFTLLPPDVPSPSHVQNAPAPFQKHRMFSTAGSKY